MVLVLVLVSFASSPIFISFRLDLPAYWKVNTWFEPAAGRSGVEQDAHERSGERFHRGRAAGVGSAR
jgi:hypothetical protein